MCEKASNRNCEAPMAGYGIPAILVCH